MQYTLQSMMARGEFDLPLNYKWGEYTCPVEHQTYHQNLGRILDQNCTNSSQLTISQGWLIGIKVCPKLHYLEGSEASIGW